MSISADTQRAIDHAHMNIELWRVERIKTIKRDIYDMVTGVSEHSIEKHTNLLLELSNLETLDGESD